MPDRTRLHELVDTLPDAALNLIQGALEKFQTWPPLEWGQEPERFREIREENRQRVRQSNPPGTGGGSGGRQGSYIPGPGGRIEHGSFGHEYWEGNSVVAVTHLFHGGYELVVEERMRLTDGGKKLEYVHAITGPDGTSDRRELAFKVAD
jgi:hypothetical protein